MEARAALDLQDLSPDRGMALGAGQDEGELRAAVSQVFVPSEQVRRNALEQVTRLLSIRTYLPETILHVMDLLCDSINDEKLSYDIKLGVCHMLFVVAPYSSIHCSKLSKLLLNPASEHLVVPLIAAAGMEGIRTIQDVNSINEKQSIIGFESLLGVAEVATLASSGSAAGVSATQKYYLSVLSEVIATILSNMKVVFDYVVLPEMGLFSLTSKQGEQNYDVSSGNILGSSPYKSTSKMEMSLIASNTEIKVASSLSPSGNVNRFSSPGNNKLISSRVSQYVELSHGYTSFKTQSGNQATRKADGVNAYTGKSSEKNMITSKLISSQIGKGEKARKKEHVVMTSDVNFISDAEFQGSGSQNKELNLPGGSKIKSPTLSTGPYKSSVYKSRSSIGGLFMNKEQELVPILIPTLQSLIYAMALGPYLPRSFARSLMNIITGSMSKNNLTQRISMDGSISYVSEYSDRTLLLAVMALRSMGKISEKILTGLTVTRRKVTEISVTSPNPLQSNTNILTMEKDTENGTNTRNNVLSNGMIQTSRLVDIGCDDANVRIAALRGLAIPLWEIVELPSMVVCVDRARLIAPTSKRYELGILDGIIDPKFVKSSTKIVESQNGPRAIFQLPPFSLPNGCIANDILEDILRIQEEESSGVRQTDLSPKRQERDKENYSNIPGSNSLLESIPPQTTPLSLPVVTMDLVILLTEIRHLLNDLLNKIANKEDLFRNYIMTFSTLRDLWEENYCTVLDDNGYDNSINNNNNDNDNDNDNNQIDNAEKKADSFMSGSGDIHEKLLNNTSLSVQQLVASAVIKPTITTSSPVPFLYRVLQAIHQTGPNSLLPEIEHSMSQLEESAIVSATADRVQEVRKEALRTYYRRAKLHDIPLYNIKNKSSLSKSPGIENTLKGSNYNLFQTLSGNSMNNMQDSDANKEESLAGILENNSPGLSNPFIFERTPLFIRKIPKLLRDKDQGVVLNVLNIIKLDPIKFVCNNEILDVLFTLVTEYKANSYEDSTLAASSNTFNSNFNNSSNNNSNNNINSNSMSLKIKYNTLQIIDKLVSNGIDCSRILETLITGFITNKLPRDVVGSTIAKMDKSGGITALIALGTKGIIPPIINREIPISLKVLAIEMLANVDKSSNAITDVIRTIIEIAQSGNLYAPAQQIAAMKTILKLRNNIINTIGQDTGNKSGTYPSSKSLKSSLRDSVRNSINSINIGGSDGIYDKYSTTVTANLPISFVYLTPERIADIYSSNMSSRTSSVRDAAAILLLELGKIGEIILLKKAMRTPGNLTITRITALETLANIPALSIPSVISALNDPDLQIRNCAEYIILNVYKMVSVEQAVRTYSTEVIVDILSLIREVQDSYTNYDCNIKIVNFLKYFEQLLLSLKN